MRVMLRWLTILVNALYAVTAMAQSVEIPRELWDRPRTGRAVFEQANVKQAVLAALANLNRDRDSSWQRAGTSAASRRAALVAGSARDRRAPCRVAQRTRREDPLKIYVVP